MSHGFALCELVPERPWGYSQVVETSDAEDSETWNAEENAMHFPVANGYLPFEVFQSLITPEVGPRFSVGIYFCHLLI